MTDTARPMARGAYQVFVSNVAATFILAVSTIVLGRLLGPSGLGLYSLALVIPAYAYVGMQLGIPTAATRFAARYAAAGDRERAASFVYGMLVFQLVVSVAFVLVLVPLSPVIASDVFHRPELGAAITLALIALVGQSAFYSAVSGLQGLGAMGRFAKLQVLQAGSRLVFQVGFLLAGLSVLGAVAGHTVGFVLSGGASFALVAVMCRRIVPKDMLPNVKTALRYGMPIYLSSMVGGLIVPFQNTLLANYASNAEIGGLSAAANITVIISLLVFPIQTVLFPAFSSFDDRRKLLDFYRLTVKYAGLFVVPAVCLVIALASPIAAAVYGRAYAFTGVFLVILAVPSILVGIGSLSMGNLLNGVGETKKTSVAGVIGSAGSLVTLPALVAYFGVYGAAVGVAMGGLLSFAVAWRMVSSVLGGNVKLSDSWKVYLCSIVSAAAVYPLSFLRLHPLVITLLGGFAFLGILVPILALTGAVTRKDAEFLESRLNGLGLVHSLLGLLLRYFYLFCRG
ncbi:MAG: oligosaccharide flippase family protein [Nitrososphaerota archaeon]|nr:oligosaccharide flippase family protein [Nitrososphaerota archaeon]